MFSVITEFFKVLYLEARAHFKFRSWAHSTKDSALLRSAYSNSVVILASAQPSFLVETKSLEVSEWFQLVTADSGPGFSFDFFAGGERISGRGPVKSCVKSRLLSITIWHDAELFKLGRRKRNYCTGRPPRQQSLILDRSVKNSKRSAPCINNLKKAKHMVVQRWRGSTKKTCKFSTSLFLIASYRS